MLGAHPSIIKAGKFATLTWSATDSTDCTLDDGLGPVPVATAGSSNVTPAATTKYVLACHGAGTATAKTTVKVN